MEDNSNIISKNHLQNHIENFLTKGPNTWLQYKIDSAITIDQTIIKSWTNNTAYPYYGLELLLRFNELKQLCITNEDGNKYSEFSDNRGLIVFRVYNIKKNKTSGIYEEALVYEVSQDLAILRTIPSNKTSDKQTQEEWSAKRESLIPFDINCFSIIKTRNNIELYYDDKNIYFTVPFHLMHPDLAKENKCRISEIRINEGLIFLEVNQSVHGGYYYSTHKKIRYVFNPENLTFILKKDLDSFLA